MIIIALYLTMADAKENVIRDFEHAYTFICKANDLSLSEIDKFRDIVRMAVCELLRMHNVLNPEGFHILSRELLKGSMFKPETVELTTMQNLVSGTLDTYVEYREIWNFWYAIQKKFRGVEKKNPHTIDLCGSVVYHRLVINFNDVINIET